ncbi:MAG: hypothetical protein OEY97_13845 [Nitrospirota bacterium]|nr:hypothetical protein [Nitrospirota bacterium]
MSEFTPDLIPDSAPHGMPVPHSAPRSLAPAGVRPRGAVELPLELLALLDAAHTDLDRVFGWLDGQPVVGGPVPLVARARARLAAASAGLKSLREAGGALPRGGA